MAGKKSSTSAKSADHLAQLTAAEKSGAAWARMFVTLARENPAGYDLEGWVSDCLQIFGDRPNEITAFYEEIQRVIAGDARGIGAPVNDEKYEESRSNLGWPAACFHDLTAVDGSDLAGLMYAARGLGGMLKRVMDDLAEEPEDRMPSNETEELLSAAMVCAKQLEDFCYGYERHSKFSRRARVMEEAAPHG